MDEPRVIFILVLTLVYKCEKYNPNDLINNYTFNLYCIFINRTHNKELDDKTILNRNVSGPFFLKRLSSVFPSDR